MDMAAGPDKPHVTLRSRHDPAQGSLAGSIARAALYGVAWGGAARLWMRYISEDPEFSVSGTGFIIAVPTIISLFSVLATRSVRWRPVARRPARAIAGFSTILLGVAAGILMMPTLLLGGIAWANRKRLPTLLLLVIAILACVPIVAVVNEIPNGRMAWALPTYLLLVATFVPVYANVYNPSGRGSAP